MRDTEDDSDGENVGEYCWWVTFLASRSVEDDGGDGREAGPEGKRKGENDGEDWNEDEVYEEEDVGAKDEDDSGGDGREGEPEGKRKEFNDGNEEEVLK